MGITRPILRRLRLGLPVCCRPADDLLPSLSISHLVASREAYRICVTPLLKSFVWRYANTHSSRKRRGTLLTLDLYGKKNSTGYPMTRRYTANHLAQYAPSTGTETQRHCAEPRCHSSHLLAARARLKSAQLYMRPSGPYTHRC